MAADETSVPYCEIRTSRVFADHGIVIHWDANIKRQLLDAQFLAVQYVVMLQRDGDMFRWIVWVMYTKQLYYCHC